MNAGGIVGNASNGTITKCYNKGQLSSDQTYSSLTIGGISGEVVSVDNDNNTFVLRSCDSQILFDKRAIYTMELPVAAKKAEETKEEENK